MDIIYSWLRLLPFAWAEYDFMLNALLAIVLLAPVFAILDK